MKSRICSAQAQSFAVFSLQDRKTLPFRAPRGGLFSVSVVFGFEETAVKPSTLVHMA